MNTEPQPPLSKDAIRGDQGLDVGLREDRRLACIMSTDLQQGWRKKLKMGNCEVCRREMILLAYKCIGEHTDAVQRKVLRPWQRKVSGSKTERITRAYIYFRVASIGSKQAGDSFRNFEKDGLPLFRDFDIWLEKNRSFIERMEEVSSDADYKHVSSGRNRTSGGV